jgi:hypothetical protein
MTPEQFNKLRDFLVEACDNHIAAGGTIISGAFRDRKDETKCCPLTCVSPDQTTTTTTIKNKLADVIGINRDDFPSIWSFIDAFDGRLWKPITTNYSMALLGRELRARYIKE